MPDDFPSRSLDKVIIRLPDGMRDRIAAAAKSNKRSMNAEIVSLLEVMYPPAPPLSDLVRVINGTIARLDIYKTDKEVSALYNWLEELCERIDGGESPEWEAMRKYRESSKNKAEETD